MARRSLLLVATFSIPSLFALVPIEDLDVYFHLRTAEWMLSHGWVPRVDPFSWTAAGTPWVAYTWLFDLLLLGLHRMAGPAGLIALPLVGGVLIGILLHRLLYRIAGQLAVAIGGTAIFLLTTHPLLTPRPWLFSMLLTVLVLQMLIAPSSDRRRWLLVPLFALWANLHIQFLYGLALVGLWSIEPVLARLSPRSLDAGPVGVRTRLLLFAACTAALCVGPYHVHIWVGLAEVLKQAPFSFVTEAAPLEFRHPRDWLVLGFALAAAVGLGWRRMRRPFLWLLLAFGSFVGLRMNRDVWMLVLASVTVLAWCLPERREVALRKTHLLVAAGGVLVLTLIIAWLRPLSRDELAAFARRTLPVAAAERIERDHLTGPLFNDFEIGGYLLWRLPQMPVSMDGRGNVYGNERILRHVKTLAGEPSWRDDPVLERARLVLVRSHRPLAELLRLDPRFACVFEEDGAILFVRRVSSREGGSASP